MQRIIFVLKCKIDFSNKEGYLTDIVITSVAALIKLADCRCDHHPDTGKFSEQPLPHWNESSGTQKTSILFDKNSGCNLLDFSGFP
jgi:hypothetical protein